MIEKTPQKLVGIGARGIRRRTVLAGLAATAFAGPLSSLRAGAEESAPLLRIAVQDFWSDNPDLIVNSGSAIFGMLQCMYDGLFEVDQTTGAVGPGIVKAWEVAPDNLSWTMHLRDDVIFHDGSKLTADDVAFSYQRLASPASAWTKSWVGLLGDPQHIEVIDPYTLRVYTNGPQPLLAYSSAAPAMEPYFVVFPKAYIEKNGADYFSQHPVGSGPYKFVSHVAGDHFEFEAVDYPHWSGKVPQFKRVIIYLVPEESTRRSMLETGQIDVIEASMQDAHDLQGEKYHTFAGGYAAARFAAEGSFQPQAKGMPLGDIRVRQAMSLAINRQEIIDTLFYGYAKLPPPPNGATPDMTPELRQKWADWAKTNYRYDPDAAKKLLVDAGYANGFSFDFWSVPDSAASYLGDLILAVAGYWEKLGIHANIVQADHAAYAAVRTTRKSDKLIGKMVADATLLSKQARVDFVNWTSQYGQLDYLGGSPDAPEFDALYVEGKSAMDPARQEQIIDRMLEISTSSWAVFSVLAAPIFYANGPNVGIDYPVWGQGLGKYFVDWKYTAT